MTIKANPDWLQRRQFAESELEVPTEEASRSPAVGCLLKFLFLKDVAIKNKKKSEKHF